MAIIRRPLSPGSGWQDVSLYRSYADLALENINRDRHFEAAVVCCIGLDVLLNTMPDRLLQFNSSKLDLCQKEVLREIQNTNLTAGGVLSRLRMACVLDRRLWQTLDQLNRARNRIIHPIKGGLVKGRAMIPPIGNKTATANIYRLLCHAIDLAGGKSPRSDAKILRQFVKERETRRKRVQKLR